jgi:hypothetical protein
MGLKFDRNVDVGMVAAVGTVALGLVNKQDRK